MTNSRHRHAWKHTRDAYFGFLYAGNLRIKGVYRCNCGKLKLGKPMKTAEQIAIEVFEDE